MSLRSCIEQIFMDNSEYKNPGQAVNQASSLNALSGDLYTDSTRFIYELLQNADDSHDQGESIKVWIKIINNYLVIAHSGKPFSARDIQGICNINNGTKKSDSSKTGYKGIGFKSVFGQSNKVTIYSSGEYFRFDSSYPFKWEWEESKTSWEEKNDRTFQFPWQIIPIYTVDHEIPLTINRYITQINANVATIIELNNVHETTESALKLSSNLNMFLFLKNISEINFDIKTSTTINIIKNGNKICLKKDNNILSEWLVNTVKLDVPLELKQVLIDDQNIPQKLSSADNIELSMAAKLNNQGITKLLNEEKVLYSYLPTEEKKYPFPVLINTSFLTSSNRESLHIDSKWNQWLFKQIAIEIFKWISNLVCSTEFQFQAYKLIPSEIHSNALANAFNEGRKEAINTIPFIISKDRKLAKVSETILDLTLLGEESFIEENTIMQFVIQNKSKEQNNNKRFAEKNDYFTELKNLGCTCFEWKDLEVFLSSKYFSNTHTLSRNKELISYFKRLVQSENNKDLPHDFSKNIKNIPFIWDHKNNLNYPASVCFPAADDKEWNNPNSQLSFLHPDLQSWLFEKTDIRHWLESIGIQEKTDITFIYQNIIPKIETYITVENAIKTVQNLFSLYKKGSLRDDLLKELSKLKLLTTKETLCPAKDCYLSDFYMPRLKIEKVLDKNIFVNEKYCTDTFDKDDWKRFFKLLGVQEGISTIKYPSRYPKDTFLSHSFNKDFFETEDHKFYSGSFKSEAYLNLTTLNYIENTEKNYRFSYRFWIDYIKNYTPDDIKIRAKAYWGYSGYSGQTTGNLIENYIPWFIRNIKCIPTLSKRCETSSKVLLNLENIKSIAGPYLPVFDGPELSTEWKSLFNFRSTLELQDYLNLLNSVYLDSNEDGKIKEENIKRIQEIYSMLLNQCINWGEEEIRVVDEWTEKGFLLNTKSQFVECSSLKYFIDGNESIFQDQYNFIQLNAANRTHPHLEKLLTHFKIKILYQDEFLLVNSPAEECADLLAKLKVILPYLKKWISIEKPDLYIREALDKVSDTLSTLQIYQCNELKITYNEINFIKNVNVHFNENTLFVTNPWNSNNVLLKLSEILCRYFKLAGYEKKLDYLLRSSKTEIQNYFMQENIDLPDGCTKFVQLDEEELKSIKSIDDIISAVEEKEISPEFFHLSISDYEKLKYIKQLIPKAVKKIMNHLESLPEYDCSKQYIISESIIGGITKNGNEIAIVARPSDDNKLLLKYTSEFDVLHYVDSELWYVHDDNIPRQLTLGHLLKETKINRIPIQDFINDESEIESLINQSKSETFDFNPIPYVPQKIAIILSSFANTNGGSLVFGIKEISLNNNEIVGLSNDFNTVEIVKKAISLLSPIPEISYEWLRKDGKSIFNIKVKKSETDILFNNNKYIRKNSHSVLNVEMTTQQILHKPTFKKNIAIIISLEEYAPLNNITDVKYAYNDAIKFKNLLINSMNIKEDEILMFTNETAFKSTLEYSLKSLFHSLTENDRLIFYYAGHGFHDGISNYLSTYDLHKSDIVGTSISLDKLLINPLKKSKCKNALIFIDACAQSLYNEHSRDHISNIDESELILLNNDYPCFSIFLSCHSGQKSYSSDNLKNGVWTYHLIQALSGDIKEVIKSDKYITDRLLNDYLSNKVSKYVLEELNYTQYPKAILDSSHENVIIEIEN